MPLCYRIGSCVASRDEAWNMNLKVIWTLFSVSLLFVSLAAGIPAVKADSINSTSYSVVEILFPANSTYDSRFLTLNVTFPCGGLHYTLTYNIDGKDEGSIPWVVDNPNNEVHVIYKAIGSVALPELSEGSHCLTVTIICGLYNYHGANAPGAPFKPTSPGSSDYEATWTDTVYFTIDVGAGTIEPAIAVDSVPPSISDISLYNRTYTSTEVPLNFTVSENISQVTYSVDGKDNVTIVGNTTLTGLVIGSHNVTLYARDVAGNTGASETITFTVVNETEPFPLVLVAVALAAMAVVGVGLTVHFKKRNHQQILVSTATAR
jgi:hypothetical protein